jgi:NDP-sugar pyrophosphorylase family protein
VSVVALIMAGGRGERMRLSGIDVSKPLVPVLGVPLLERNVRHLLQHGLDDIVVSVAADNAEVRAFVQSLPVEALVEATPMGNIGCAAELRGRGTVLVLYADNLTTLDLTDVLAVHSDTAAALTLASHDEPFRLPYGRLTLDNDRVTAYEEKPSIAVTVCSAIAVLGPEAVEAIDGPMGLVDLTNVLLRNGSRVTAYRHDAPWVDVNDVRGVARAEALVREHAGEFA